VDLDGTLLRTDSLYESLIASFRNDWKIILELPGWLASGRQVLKDALAERAHLDVKELPFNEQLLEYLREKSESGRTLILASAANKKIATEIAEYLGIFSNVLASDRITNLKGTRKLEAIESLLPGQAFDYIGNSSADLVILAVAREGYLVTPTMAARAAAKSLPTVSELFPERVLATRKPAIILRACRPHRWLKNLLLFLPLAAFDWNNVSAWISVLIGFIGFSLCASATYVINDLIDIRADRTHPRKKFRPLASGELQILEGMIVALALLCSGLIVCALVNLGFVLLAAGYVGLSLTYSVWLKQEPIVHVMTLAALYVYRLLAGASAISVVPTYSLLALSFFLFLSLAILKRAIELHEHLRDK